MYSGHSAQNPRGNFILIILFGSIGVQEMNWAAYLIVACKHSPPVNNFSL